jgi:hypothetical protein
MAGSVLHNRRAFFGDTGISGGNAVSIQTLVERAVYAALIFYGHGAGIIL